eukprot:scaffold54379_cov21-Prasinocladus_malaysianus.AAC.1
MDRAKTSTSVIVVIVRQVTSALLLLAMILLIRGVGASQCGSEGSPGCTPGFCCSQWGFCGTGDDFCGAGCQAGPCSSDNNDLLLSPVAVEDDQGGRCGADFPGSTCPDHAPCCSQWGYCGSGDDFCGGGCQAGPCDADEPADSDSPIVSSPASSPPSEVGRCGADFPGSSCPEFAPCCSQWGFCGSGDDFCGVGCQAG